MLNLALTAFYDVNGEYIKLKVKLFERIDGRLEILLAGGLHVLENFLVLLVRQVVVHVYVYVPEFIYCYWLISIILMGW